MDALIHVHHLSTRLRPTVGLRF
ncbi:hypothetical protein CGRA01v4_13531 [Colletotrichum graminicola]|nr:hypothetical protein CGRA01v4_13531 [Colletotrichum graminicola]